MSDNTMCALKSLGDLYFTLVQANLTATFARGAFKALSEELNYLAISQYVKAGEPYGPSPAGVRLWMKEKVNEQAE